MGKIVHQSVDSDMMIYKNIKSDYEDVASQLAEKAKQIDLMNYIKSKVLTEKTNRTHYFLFDSFIRADSAISLGNAETNNTAWSYESSTSTTVTWGISSNNAYQVSRSGGSLIGIAWQDTKEADALIEVDLSGVSGMQDGGIAFRVSDKDNFYQASVHGVNNSVCLYKWVAGVKTEIFRNFGYTIGDGKLSVLLRGNKIEVYLDGILMIKQWDSFNNTATKHGICANAGNSLNYRWKNISIKPVSVVPISINETFDAPISKWYWTKETPVQSYSLNYDSTIKESGNSSLRVELHNDDIDVSNSRRCEIKLPVESPLEEHWYGVSIYLPKGGSEDYANDVSSEILTQWHGVSDSGAGETEISPPLSLMTSDGNWKIVQRYHSSRVTTNAIANEAVGDLGSYQNDKGKWVQWVFHVKWGYLDIHEPITEVFKDGILVYSRKGANTYNDQSGIYPKIGVYKWNWKDNNPVSLLTKRVVYYDNYWVK